MMIHVISTVNGQVNEGMRNVATHIARAFETDHKVYYSGLKDIGSIIRNSRCCDITMIFARANKLVYWLTWLVTFFSKNVWIICVQKPDADFTALTKKHPLKVNYLTLVGKDLDRIIFRQGFGKKVFEAGIKADKFCPIDEERQKKLKQKYGMDPEKPLVIHVGHCSAGRGLEDFAAITDAQRMVVASGMFESSDTVTCLKRAGVKIHTGYLEHVEEIYQMADVYLFPTHSTEYVISIPLSVMEALSCGVPVIAYKDFSNLSEIPAADGAITLIGDKCELNKTVCRIAKKKQNHSFLKHPKTWEAVADDVLKNVRGN